MILLDYKDRRPIYEQVAEKLEELMPQEQPDAPTMDGMNMK